MESGAGKDLCRRHLFVRGGVTTERSGIGCASQAIIGEFARFLTADINAAGEKNPHPHPKYGEAYIHPIPTLGQSFLHKPGPAGLSVTTVSPRPSTCLLGPSVPGSSCVFRPPFV